MGDVGDGAPHARGNSFANGPLPEVFRDWQFRMAVLEARTTIWDVMP